MIGEAVRVTTKRYSEQFHRWIQMVKGALNDEIRFAQPSKRGEINMDMIGRQEYVRMSMNAGAKHQWMFRDASVTHSRGNWIGERSKVRAIDLGRSARANAQKPRRFGKAVYRKLSQYRSVIFFGTIMKKLSLSIFVFLTAVFAFSAVAAQDQSLIETTRKNQLANDAKDRQEAATSGKSEKTVEQIKLPLDHGPHAQVTPWVNQQRRMHAKEESEQK